MTAAGFKKLLYKSVGWCLVLMAGCITPYDGDVKEVPPGIVVQGFISNEEGPYTVRLTTAANYTYAGLNYAIENATVYITDNEGNRENLVHKGLGEYQTQTLRGQTGRTYQLHIEANGKRYQSRPETIRPVSKIDRVYDESYRIIDPNTRQDILGGWKVYIDTKDPAESGNYYRWSWKHYKQAVFCGSVNDRNGNPLYGLFCCNANCWDIVRCMGPNCINVANDALINGKNITRQEVAEVPVGCLDRYYIEIEQQALSRDAYVFWNTVKRMLQNTGGMFDVTPSAIPGNMTNVTNPDEDVFGYFGAIGVERVGYYVDRTGADRSECDMGMPYPPTGGIPPPCAPCAESLYRTAKRPGFWE
ncbi:DUF4249 domain-containing protein [Telluribacter sp. SYSU D00476]|uniref:DUF4249 domain-containing protein n=1 Tax=Telluribacter sp. SYSU D00476 TaxID=2811430 RepID=UPI001FF4E14D|nr:DUF4249 domain-containing protein [Telluribacter sp. SYSU D00476]